LSGIYPQQTSDLISPYLFGPYLTPLWIGLSGIYPQQR